MNCGEWTPELIDTARRGGRVAELSFELRTHLTACPRCWERWEAERQLSSHLTAIRNRTAGMRSHAVSREALLQHFARTYRRPVVPAWTWALAAAAALVLAVLIGHTLGRTAGTQAAHRVQRPKAVVYEASETLSNDASAFSSDDFIAVPYTPPLAPGEMVQVVHADLDPQVLASMGVEVDPSSGDRLPADVVVGEDGLPRAVRISDNSQY